MHMEESERASESLTCNRHHQPHCLQKKTQLVTLCMSASEQVLTYRELPVEFSSFFTFFFQTLMATPPSVCCHSFGNWFGHLSWPTSRCNCDLSKGNNFTTLLSPLKCQLLPFCDCFAIDGENNIRNHLKAIFGC